MPHPALYPLTKNTITDLVETIISLNSAGQKAYPKHYWGMNKTPKEIAEKAVQSLLKFQMLIFDKLYAVNVDGDVQNIMFEKSPAGLFSNHFLELLVYDLECTTVTKDEFMAFVDKDADAVKRDAAFVRDFLPKYNIFFEDAQYDNTTILTRVQNENAQQNQSASVGAEAYAGVSWLGLIGAKASAKASLETANSKGTQTALTESMSPYLSTTDRTTILTLASAYMMDKVHNMVHPEWPEMNIMTTTRNAKKLTDALNQNRDDIISLQRLYQNPDLIKLFNALQINNDFIHSFVGSLVRYGYMEYLGKIKNDPSVATFRDDTFWLDLSRKIENNRSELMEDEIQYILKYQKVDPMLRLIAGAMNAYSMTDTALEELKTAIRACKIPESVINTHTVSTLNPEFTYCPKLFRVNPAGYKCEPDNLVFFNNPYAGNNEDATDDVTGSTGFILIDQLAELFPLAAKKVNFNSDNHESSTAFVAAVNSAVAAARLENSADFMITMHPVPSEVGGGGVISAHKISVGYADTDGNALPLTPEGVRYSGVAKTAELTYPVSALFQQKRQREKRDRETRQKENFHSSSAKNGVMSVADLLKITPVYDSGTDAPKTNGTRVTP